MHFERTRHYFDTAAGYRKGLRDIWARYEAEMQKIEKYKGSAGYTEKAAELTDAKDKAVRSLQEEYSRRFSSILDGMRESAKSRPMTAPTTDEINLLSVLKMREKITADELQAAAITLKNSPVALSVLDEIVQKNEIRGVHFGVESTASIIQKIDNLAEASKRIVALNKPDSRREMVARASIHSPEHTSDAMYSFSYDRDFLGVEDCLAYCGGVDNVQAFGEAVNE